MKNVAIIGGGVAGLASAYRLLKSGHHVTIYERNSNIGGQLHAFPILGQMTEIYYHHTFISDTNFIELCRELGIEEKLMWYTTSMAYYSSGKQYSFSTAIDLLKFKPLKFIDKIKFGLSILQLQNISDIDKVKKFGAKEWFYSKGYENVWNVIWEPLFKLKFAELSDQISLVWLWDKLIKRGKSRSSGKEKLCYMDGSFYELAKALESNILKYKGIIKKNTPVTSFKVDNDRLLLSTIEDVDVEYDYIISTLSAKHHESIFNVNSNNPKNYAYQAAICAVLVSEKPFSDFYWTNVGDYDIPFGGIIEHSNFVGKDKYKGKSLIYLSKYLNGDSSFYKKSNEEILKDFYSGLKTINKSFDEKSIIESYVFKQPDAQPIVKTGYTPPSLETEIKNLYWISTHHVYPHDRGIEYAIELANKVSENIND